MHERFLPGARQAIARAQQAARDLGHDVIRTEHLLLGILAGETGPAVDALTAQNVSHGSARREIERLTGVGESDEPGMRPYTERARVVVNGAPLEAAKQGAERIGAEHLLLAILAESDSNAVLSLRRLGADPKAMAAGLAAPRPGLVLDPDDEDFGASSWPDRVPGELSEPHRWAGPFAVHWSVRVGAWGLTAAPIAYIDWRFAPLGPIAFETWVLLCRAVAAFAARPRSLTRGLDRFRWLG